MSIQPGVITDIKTANGQLMHFTYMKILSKGSVPVT